MPTAAPRNNDHSSHPIVFPEHDDDVMTTALDIGGTLAKSVYFTPLKRAAEDGRGSEITRTGGRLNFVKCDSHDIEQLCEVIEESWVASAGSEEDSPPGKRKKTVAVTGGGAYKFGKALEERLGIEVIRVDEMTAAVKGATFLMKEIPDAIFCIENMEKHPVDVDIRTEGQTIDGNGLYPYLLVNVGSGVSLVKVVDEHTFQRVSGTSLGGATFWGLGRLLTSASTFEEILAMAERGDSRNVDMLVGDIYGGNYTKIGLSEDTIASSMGKAVRGKKEDFNEEDIAMSLLRMISYNIGQLAYNTAELHGLKRIFFVNFWSAGSQRAHFFRHDGYLGALGTLIDSMEQQGQAIFTGKNSWIENFGGMRRVEDIGFGPQNLTVEVINDNELSSPVASQKASTRSLAVTTEIVFDMEDDLLVSFPKLEDPHAYQFQRATLDLKDARLRSNCLEILRKTRPLLLDKAVESEGGTEDAIERAKDCSDLMSRHAQRLMTDPFAYGELSFPFILELREQCLRECGFEHVYWKDKERETEAALRMLPGSMEQLSLIKDDSEKIRAALCSVLAGNVFDWGSLSTQRLYQKGGGAIDFSEIRRRIEEEQEWIFDGSKDFARKLLQGNYKKGVFFFDNSGADCILGMIPLVEAFLRYSPGASVVLSANPTPVINDVTHSELAVIVGRVVSMKAQRQRPPSSSESVEHDGQSQLLLPHLAQALKENRVRVLSNGQQGPCIDLRRIPETLAKECRDSDLLVLEGLARAIHSNFHAKFTIDTLKLALVKSEIVAEYFGCSTMDAVCKFEEVK